GKRLGYFASGSRRVFDVAEGAVVGPGVQEQLLSLRAEMDQGALPEERDFCAVGGGEGGSVSPGVRSPSGREGSPHVIHRSIHGETYTLNAENFFQTNTDLLPQLIDAALADERGESAVELYSGVGLFTLPLARRFQQVIAVEGDTAAARY